MSVFEELRKVIEAIDETGQPKQSLYIPGIDADGEECLVELKTKEEFEEYKKHLGEYLHDEQNRLLENLKWGWVETKKDPDHFEGILNIINNQ